MRRTSSMLLRANSCCRQAFFPHLHTENCAICNAAANTTLFEHNVTREETPAEAIVHSSPTLPDLKGILSSDSWSMLESPVAIPSWFTEICARDEELMDLSTIERKRSALEKMRQLDGAARIAGGGGGERIKSNDVVASLLDKFNNVKQGEGGDEAQRLSDGEFEALAEYFDGFTETATTTTTQPKGEATAWPQQTKSTSDNKNEKQERFQRALADFADVMAMSRFDFFLCCGTALGVIRDGKFIDHDDDIDVGVFYDKDNTQDCVHRLLHHISEQGTFFCFDILGKIGFGFEARFIHPATGVLIDLNVYYHQQEVEPEKEQVLGQCSANSGSNSKEILWCATHYSGSAKRRHGMYRYRHTPFRTETVSFAGRQFQVPPVSYLEEYYGSDWMIPKKYSYEEGLAGEYRNIIDE